MYISVSSRRELITNVGEKGFQQGRKGWGLGGGGWEGGGGGDSEMFNSDM